MYVKISGEIISLPLDLLIQLANTFTVYKTQAVAHLAAYASTKESQQM